MLLKKIKPWFLFFVAYCIVITIHEGFHVLISYCFEEYQTFRIHPYGFEVIFKTPPEIRHGFSWLLISGFSNIATVLLGYTLYLFQRTVIPKKSLFKLLLFYLTLILLLADPINIFIGTFFYQGDAFGIARGLETSVIYIQIFGLIILLLNRELVSKYLLSFGIRVNHILLKPWLIKK